MRTSVLAFLLLAAAAAASAASLAQDDGARAVVTAPAPQPMPVTLGPGFNLTRGLAKSNDTEMLKGFLAEPRGRGTIRVFINCILMLFLCVCK